MIFVTVGAQMPFDRLVHAVDDWARETGRGDVFAQVGDTEAPPTHVEYTKFIEPPAFRERVESSSAIIAHAGMGSILTALGHGKPIVIMPRRGDLRETRNDHQVATARHLSDRPGVYAAMDEGELRVVLEALDPSAQFEPIPPHASAELIGALKAFIGEVGS